MPHGEMTAKNGSIPSKNKKRKIDLKEERDRQTDGQTDRVNDKNNRLLA